MRQRTMFNFMATVIAAAILALCEAVTAQTVTYTDLHDFNPSAGDPATLFDSGLIPQGRDGEFYGTSQYGGTSNQGTVFKVSPTGTPTILASLDSTDGEYPTCGLTFGTDGNFYGAAPQGGTSNVGTVFKITPTGTLTVLHNFTNNGDGGAPTCPPVEASNKNFYGVTTGDISGVQGVSTFYEITSKDVFTTIHVFANSEGTHCSGITQGTDGNFYGACLLGGTNNMGTLYKISSAGKVTVLHSLDGTDGMNEQGDFFVQAKDGNFYGVGYNGGTYGYGVIFQLKPSGTYTVLHDFTGGADGGNPNADFTLGTDGNLYSTTSVGGSSGNGVIFKLTTAGVFTVLYNFDGTHGSNPQSNLTLSTDGLFYGETESGGAHGDGVFYSFDVGLKPFISIYPTSGTAGTAVGIMGQGFDSTSVVTFGGVPATKITLTGTTYITATVPAGAVNGYVTVTTGSTTLTSLKTFTVHNSWSSATAMPTAVYGSATGVLSGNIYVVGGYTTAPTADVQIYNPDNHTWSTGTSLPTATSGAAAAVVSNVLYVFGGYTGSYTNAVWAYNPTTKTWTAEAAMPTARNGAVAVVEKNIVYVAGGYNGTDFLATVESYNPTTKTWTEKAPMLQTKDFPAGGLIGTKIVITGGANAAGSVTGDTEGYDATTNTWTSLTADPTAREASCYGVSGVLYDVGGYINNGGAATTVNESFTSSSDKWTTTLASIPQGTMFPGSAVYNGQLFCFGGESTWTGSPIGNVQIYQP
ncbi:MAG: choice-of-anchor tandem repeat GloVer-containing protein [Candidatus Sulfotelmatobacter sp.]